MNHIIVTPPSPAKSNYQQWKQNDSIVLSWIITNIEQDLIDQFIDYNTSWDLWVGNEILLGSGRDELHIFNLSSMVALLKQNQDPIEIYFRKLDTI